MSTTNTTAAPAITPEILAEFRGLVETFPAIDVAIDPEAVKAFQAYGFAVISRRGPAPDKILANALRFVNMRHFSRRKSSDDALLAIRPFLKANL